MEPIRSILFAPLTVVGGVAAIRRVAAFADQHDATVTLFDAVPTPSRLDRLRHHAHVEEMAAEERHAAHQRLESLGEKLGPRAAPPIVVAGDPATRIIEEVTTAGHDLVIVTAHDDDPPARTTVKRLERSCPVPLWVLRPTRAKEQRILAAVDTDPNHDDLNVTIVRLAAQMAEVGGGELQLLHSWTLYGEAALRTGSFTRVPPAELDAMIDAEHDERMKAIERLLLEAGVSDAPWEIHLVKGAPAATIIDIVRRQRINLLVMGTAARSGLVGFLIGNTAETVLSDVPCSVITLKAQ